ncbi:malate dehydrogenase, mitochondrial-like [Diabrotica virgifera virgifera]|uniref:malate dehydrogenase n=1 Tax=Diabrotica virgifera virgifera TaxID=50390 RepID=A0ABM5KEN9_DIAVI|nr:malate dehydrogenase, mitochondrial-like [Diabrotica virgifera virgifera]
MNLSNLQRLFSNYSTQSFATKNLSTESKRSSIQVCILNAHTPLGKMTSFLIKQNPLVSKVKIQGDRKVTNLAEELNLIDTKCRVEPYPHVKDLPKSLMGVDIVLLLSNQVWPQDTPIGKRILGESQRVYDVIKECTLQAPKATVIVAVPPVSVFTPFVANVFKQSHFYHPGKILGSAAMAQVTINSLVGRYHDMDPFITHVPLIGGPDIDVAVPLLSRAKPVPVPARCTNILMSKFRQVELESFPKIYCKQNCNEYHPISEAYALNNMIVTLGLGILEDPKAVYNAFVRTNVVSSCQYLVTLLQFSKEGVVHNFGLPTLTHFELGMLERAITLIKLREEIATELVSYVEGKCKTPIMKRAGFN